MVDLIERELACIEDLPDHKREDAEFLRGMRAIAIGAIKASLSRIAELEAEMERLRKKNEYLEDRNEECEHWRIHWKTKAFEALSRTGAVKVHCEDVAKLVYEAMSWAAMCGPTPNGTVPVWEDRGNSLGQEEARRIADRILSVLEPAAPEDHQPAALTYGQKLIAEAISSHFGERGENYDEYEGDTTVDDVWDAFDALTRPSEQAVTEADLKAAYILGRSAFAPAHVLMDESRTEASWQKARASLKAAMEAGRHD